MIAEDTLDMKHLSTEGSNDQDERKVEESDPLSPSGEKAKKKKKKKAKNKKSSEKSPVGEVMKDASEASEQSKKKKNKKEKKKKSSTESSSSLLYYESASSRLDDGIDDSGRTTTTRTTEEASIGGSSESSSRKTSSGNHPAALAYLLNPIRETEQSEDDDGEKESGSPVVDKPMGIALSQRSERSLEKNFSSAVANTWGARAQIASISPAGDENKTLLDDLASFAEASLGTSTDDASALLSIPGGLVDSVNEGGGVPHELLVAYMLSVGASREHAESLAFSFMGQQNVQLTQRTSSQVFPRLTPPRTPLGRQRSGSSRVMTTRKLADISRAASESSIRSEIADLSQSRRRSTRAGRSSGYVRADEPGAVEMEGRAFGAPIRLQTTPSLRNVENEEYMRPNIFVEAEPVQDGNMPVVYAESSPLSIKHLF